MDALPEDEIAPTAPYFLKLRVRLFGNTAMPPTERGGFVPLFWLLRRVQRLFRPREWQVFTYVAMRADQYGLCWPTDREIAGDLGVHYRKIAPNLRSLVALGFLKTCTERGRRYLCVVDPITVVRSLARNGTLVNVLPREQIEALAKDLEAMRQPPLGTLVAERVSQ